MKIVYNNCFGGFSLSEDAISLLESKGYVGGYYKEIERHNPLLVEVVEELGELCNGMFSELKIHETEEDKYFIFEYDGLETVYTPNTLPWIET
jgi:hypothetical protein